MHSDLQEARCEGGRSAVEESWSCRPIHAHADVVPLLDEVMQALDALGYPGKDQFAVRLALEEAVVNAIEHAHRGDVGKTVRVRFRATPAYWLAEVEDEGPGFDPRQVPDPRAPENRERPGGRGLLLMRHYMTWVRHNARGTCVTLCKQRDGRN